MVAGRKGNDPLHLLHPMKTVVICHQRIGNIEPASVIRAWGKYINPCCRHRNVAPILERKVLFARSGGKNEIGDGAGL